MLLAILAQMAALNPDIATLRYNSAMSAWSECIDLRVERLAASTSEPVSKSALVYVALDQCHVMSVDARRTFPDVVRMHFADEGVVSYTESMVDLIADEMATNLAAEMRTRKVAQFAE